MSRPFIGCLVLCLSLPFPSLEASAQEAGKGTLSEAYCGTAWLQESAAAIGGTVGRTFSDGETRIEAPEIGDRATLKVRCGRNRRVVGDYEKIGWPGAFRAAYVSVAARFSGIAHAAIEANLAKCQKQAIRATIADGKVGDSEFQYGGAKFFCIIATTSGGNSELHGIQFK